MGLEPYDVVPEDMKEFSSFAGLAEQLIKLSVFGEVEHHMLERVGVMVEKRAKEKIGEYQGQAGQFIAWPELADSTQKQREDLGYDPDKPLLRDGTLRDSIEHRTDVTEVHIGSDNPIAEYQELGTEHIPPRSFLGGAAFELTPKIVDDMGIEVTAYLAGENVFGGRLKVTDD